MTGVPSRCAPRRTAIAALVVLLGTPVVLSPGASASQSAAPALNALPRDQTLEETRLREAQAAGDLENSSKQVQEAAAALRLVAEQLPGAQQAVAKAKGELAGAQAKLAASRAAVARAEQARSLAQGRVDAAGLKVQAGRDDVGQLARRSYQRGRVGGLQDVMEAGDPQDVLQRATMLRSVFRYQDGTLKRLTQDRLALARVEADLAVDEREVQALTATAEQGEVRARQITGQAEAAAAKVAELVASQQAALGVAEANRAQDTRDYQAAQTASRELAERIRQAEAAAEAARVAREAADRAAREAATREAAAAREASDRAARTAAARSGRPAPAPAPAPQRAPVQAPTQDRAGAMQWPVPGRLTSRFGNRVHPIYGDVRLHAGIDIGAPNGTPIVAADDGVAIIAGPTGSYGNFVVLSHGAGLSTSYAHQSSLAVSPGQSVRKGQVIGYVGSTGASTGNHLHFEVRRNGEPVDPLGYVSLP